MLKPTLKFPTILSRMFRASMLDGSIFREVKADPTAERQAFFAVLLAGLGTGIGIGLAGLFRTAGELSGPGLLLWLLVLLFLWLTTSLWAWFFATRVFRVSGKAATIRQLLGATGFAFSPGVMGIFAFIPSISGIVLIIITIWIFLAFVAALKNVFNTGFGRAAASWGAGSAVVLTMVSVAVVIAVMSEIWFGNWSFTDSFDSRLNAIVQSHRFSIASWELKNVPSGLTTMMNGKVAIAGNASDNVKQFFSTGERAQSEQHVIEKILENQIKDTLAAENITGFPPIDFQLTLLPRLLVISPRNEIESMREILLDPRLSRQQIEDIEKKADDLGVSSLIVEIGGFAGAYPTLVSSASSLSFAIDAAVEEWLHQYLAFRPLGFRYVLDLTGIKRDYEIAMINEAVAGMVSRELGAKISRQNYPDHKEPVYDNSDFYRQMRDIRLKVDDYLAKGEIEAAEEYMEQKREELAREGYYIRKLNQAYFAWHGTYADQPQSISPIGAELRQLRIQCTSVKHFLDIVSKITSRQDLQLAISSRMKDER